MIVIFKRGPDLRILRHIRKIDRRYVGGRPYILFHPRCMFSVDYLDTYDAIAVVGGIRTEASDYLHWVKEP